MLTAQNTSAANVKLPTVLNSFDYEGRFVSSALQQQALDALESVLNFCRTTFDRLLELGKKLWDFYQCCIEELGKEQGKAAFYDWLKSDEFGSSTYIAKIAMEFSPWFCNLQPKLQNLVSKKVLDCSASALKQLTKVPAILLEELLSQGSKLTQASIKSTLAGFITPEDKQPKLRKGGYAEVAIKGHRLEGQIGQIVDKPDELGNAVLEMEESELTFKVEDLKSVRKPRQIQNITKDSETGELIYTQEELNDLIASASAKHDEEKPVVQHILEESIVATPEVNLELETIKASLTALTQANEKLQQQLEERDRELVEMRSHQLQSENQQLKQRVQELEMVVAESKNWAHTAEQSTFTAEQELEKKYANTLEKQQQLERELSEYKNPASSNTRTKTIDVGEDVDALTTELGTALELFQIPGWGDQGYRTSDNKLYKGWDALKAFLDEAFSSHNSTERNWEAA